MEDFNPYAAPGVNLSDDRLATDADEGRGVWRDGDVLVMVKIARLPSRCVRCNEPATARLKRSLSWHNPWLFLLIIFPSWIIYLIVALIVRKTAKIELPICEEHRAKRSRGILIAWVVALSGLACGFAPAAIGDGPWVGGTILVGAILVLVGLIMGMIVSRLVVTQKIDDTHVWLKKVGPLYLAGLPRLPTLEERMGTPKPDFRFEDL